MRIALVSEHANPLATREGVAGAQHTHVAALSEALAERGHDVTVYTRRDSARAPNRVRTSSGAVVEHVRAGPTRSLPDPELLRQVPEFGAQLARRWAGERPEVVHAHFWMSGLAALVGARDLGIPVVQTFHTLGLPRDGQSESGPSKRVRLERAIARDSTRVVATCSEEEDALVRLGVRRDVIRLVPHGVDTERFTPEGSAVASRGQRVRALCAGGLAEAEGVGTVIEAFRRVPDIDLVVAGGPDAPSLDDDPDYRRLRAMAKRTGTADRISFIGRVDPQHMPSLYRSADLVISVPWHEAQGIVPLEAMACGVPVVASTVWGLADMVVEGATGALIPPRRPDALALALRRILADPVRRQGFGIAAADRARARYAWPRITRDMIRIYTEAAHDAPSPA